MKLSIRQYDAQFDEKEVFNLWQENFGEVWSLDFSSFKQIISLGNHFVTTDDEKIAGFIATQTLGEKTSILTIIGNDKGLLNYATQYLKSKKAKQIQLGGGGSSYFWPGIPTNLPTLIKFFAENGWKFTEDSFDLIRNTADYQTPPFVFERLGKVKIKTAQAGDVQAVLSFEQKNFPEWLFAYKHKIDLNDLGDIFFAENNDKKIIGTVFIFSDASQSAKENQIWKKLLGDDMGGICCLGVREAMRKKGIGLALAAYATEILHDRKVGNVYVGYTWLIDWYGKLGYKVWRQYKMSWKKL